MPLEQTSPITTPPPDVPLLAGAASKPIPGDARLNEVLEITKEMFAAAPVVEVMCDPDDPDHPFVSITVQVRGDTREIIQHHIDWGDRVRPLNEDLLHRLSIVPLD